MRVYYDRDADISRILDKKIAIVGYGSQGRAHALNLHDSGAKNVVVALKPGSATAKKVEADGLKVMSVAEAAKWADVLMVLAPDEVQRDIYKADIAPNIRDGAALLFAHGLNVHFGLIEPKASVDVLMVAPKGPGHTVRGEYQKGGGVPCLIAVHQDSTGGAIADVGRDLGVVDAALQLVGGQDHQHVGPLGGVRDAHHLQAVGFHLLGGGRAGLEGDHHVLRAGVGEVERMGPALRTVAYDRDLLVQDAGNVGVAVIVDAHDCSPGTKKAGGRAQCPRPKAGGVKPFFAGRSREAASQRVAWAPLSRARGREPWHFQRDDRGH